MPCICPKQLTGDFSEFREGGLKNRDHPKILHTRDLTNEVVKEAPCSVLENLEKPNLNSDTDVGKETDCLLEPTHNLSERDTIGKDISDETKSVIVIEPDSELKDLSSSESLKTPNANIEEEDLAVVPLTIVSDDEKEIRDNPPHKITDQSSVLKENSSNETLTSNIEDLLNSSLVPYEYTSKDGGQQQKLLVSYPVNDDPNEIRPNLQQDKEPSKVCNCIAEKGYCDCGCCHRKPNLPFGRRFPTDIDSLHRIIGVGVPYRDMLTPHSTGYTSSIKSGSSSGFEQFGNQQPKVYLNGYSMSSGSGYYSDPSKDVYYNEPTMLDLLRGSNYVKPHLTHTRLVEPHLYKVIPKYNILPKKIVSLDVPDLVNTNKFICSCPQIYHGYHHNVEQPTFYCPIHGHVPSTVSYERSPRYYDDGDHFLGYVNDLRGIQ